MKNYRALTAEEKKEEKQKLRRAADFSQKLKQEKKDKSRDKVKR